MYKIVHKLKLYLRPNFQNIQKTKRRRHKFKENKN